MILGLSTRGYLCPAGSVQFIVGAGPVIVDSQVARPGIIGAASSAVAGPGISGSVVPGPSISGSSTPATTGVEPPHISGSDKPKIG
jgi:hypothetical protein